jgi:DHA1 family bicyclomycin/chloramphenicol resistance-like MFS transporter
VTVLTFDAFTGFGGLAGMVGPLFACLACMGLLMPVATVGALSRHAAHAGSASALIGTWQFGLAAITGTLVGVTQDGTGRSMAVIMLLCVLGACVADLYRPRS